MKERPILFSAPMVQAILEGRKTQTRRVINPQPKLFGKDKNHDGEWWMPVGGIRQERWLCPFGKIGDRLWVRETWQTVKGLSCDSGVYAYIYKASFEGNANFSVEKWKPSIHMPRLASRITLEITNIRVERIQDISESDAIAEGLSKLSKDGVTWKYGIPDSDRLPGNDDIGWHWKEWNISAKTAFAKLWNKINAKRGFSFESNPFVWVIEFEQK